MKRTIGQRNSRSIREIAQINPEQCAPITGHGDSFEYIDIESIDSVSGLMKPKTVRRDSAPSRARRIVREDDVIMSTVRPYLKAFALVPPHLTGQVCSTGFAVLRARREMVEPRYLLFALFSDNVTRQCNQLMVGGQYPALSPSQVAGIRISLPPLPEQRKIVEILSTVDEAIRKTEEAIEHSERLKRALLHDLLNKRQSVNRQLIELGSVCRQRKELIQPNTSSNGLFVGLEHIDSGVTTISRTGEASTVRSSKFKFYHGDVLYGKLRPYLDKAVKATVEGICSTDILTLTTSNQLTSDYLVWLLHSQSFMKHAIASTTGTNHPRTSWNHIAKFRFHLPTIDEQNRITRILDAVEKGYRLKEMRKQTLERIKKVLVDDLITGKVRHPDFTGGGSS